ncbi:MAG TPA: S-methyl-5'-thioadenosine phosphorylase [Verrucomicrobiae bacterium]|nr:S-methyl-5'-thioadenosine phosphorylase [Verrucomicrobiae bacterium]
MPTKIGVIGGSGLYDMPDIRDKRWRRVATPFGQPSDQLLTGRLGQRDIVFLPRHGRGHRILPSELNHRANIYALKKLGVTHIISVSAVGSLKEQYKPTDIVAIDQFIDRTKRSADLTFFGHGIVGHIAFADPICDRLRRILVDSARRAGATVHDGGTYVNMEGPAFSTRAESLFHRAQGWDVVGMTNYGEARCAREAELCYATLAMVTDYDAWHPDHDAVTVEMVVANLTKNSATAREIIRRAAAALDPAADCACRHALATAIMTDPNAIPPAARKRLRLLLL